MKLKLNKRELKLIESLLLRADNEEANSLEYCVFGELKIHKLIEDLLDKVMEMKE
jgi:hypothetical protein